MSHFKIEIRKKKVAMFRRFTSCAIKTTSKTLQYATHMITNHSPLPKSALDFKGQAVINGLW